jgi:enamine deaminase RidA (YjgF/YER057c/UK114 family)
MPACRKTLHVPPPSGFGPLPFSMGVLAGGAFYLAGHIGVDPATKKIPEDLDREIWILMEGLRHTLAQADLTLDDLVPVQVFCPDVSLKGARTLWIRTGPQTPAGMRAAKIRAQAVPRYEEGAPAWDREPPKVAFL